LVLAAALVAALAVAAPSAQAAKKKKGPTITVMTRNLFLGADLIPLATTDPGAQFEQTATNMFNGVKAEDPNGRMKLVAGEIAKAKPDLVGPQEPSLWWAGAAPSSIAALPQINKIH
jgi:hypothetical protein